MQYRPLNVGGFFLWAIFKYLTFQYFLVIINRNEGGMNIDTEPDYKKDY